MYAHCFCCSISTCYLHTNQVKSTKLSNREVFVKTHRTQTVSVPRNNHKSHTLIQTLLPPATVSLTLVIPFSLPSYAHTTISPNRSNLVSWQESKPRLDSMVQVAAELGRSYLKAGLRTQSEAPCAHKRQHTQLQERQRALVTTCLACLRAAG